MTLRRGDVVLVPFPCAELTTTKTRPAVLISGKAFAASERRITVAAITSNVAAHRNATSYELTDWAAAGLQKPSVVTAWLATISPGLVDPDKNHESNSGACWANHCRMF
jgi:mRNA-degrading endonuclease toxin of MazEF toxin-antitoxin module